MISYRRADLLNDFVPYEIPEGTNFQMLFQIMHSDRYEWIVFRGAKPLFYSFSNGEKLPAEIMERVHQYIIENLAKIGFIFTANNEWILQSTPVTTNIHDRLSSIMHSFKGFETTFRNGATDGAVYDLKTFYEYAKPS